MKKGVSILILFVLLVHFTGYYVYFMVRMTQIRAEMRREISHLPLTRLTKFEFTPDEYRKAKVDDQELKVDGKMYDIARMETARNRVIVYARHDAAEDSLLSFFSEVFGLLWNDKQSSPSSLINFLTLSFIVEPCLDLHFEWTGECHNTGFQSHLYSAPQYLESPPPRG